MAGHDPRFQSFAAPCVGASETTLHVRAGEVWRFAASGRWLDGVIPCGPDGHRIFAFHVLDIRPPLEDAPWFCLVGRYRNRPGTEFRIGAGVTHEFTVAGEIEFLANDHGKHANWKSGAVTVTAENLAALPHDSNTVSGTWRFVLEAQRAKNRTGIGAHAMALFSAIGPAWKRTREVFDRTTGLVFVATLILGAGAALAFMPQGQDLMRSMSEDPPLVSGLPGSQQVWFGLSLFFLCMQAWFWPRVIINFNYGSNRTLWRPKRILTLIPWVLGSAPAVFAGIAMFSSPKVSVPFALATFLAPLAFFGWVLFRFDRRTSNLVKRMQESRNARAARRNPRAKPASPPRVGRLWVSLCIVLAIVSVVVLCIWPIAVTQALGAPAVVFFGFGLLIAPAILLIQTGAPVRYPVLGTAIALAVVWSLFLTDHVVGHRAAHAPPAGEIRQTSLDDAYAKWLAQAPRDKDGKIPIILVAAEGGASRAGYWTGEVLSELERRTQGQFSKSVFAISSVSGGSVGAVGFAAALQDHRADRDALKAQVNDLTKADALSPVVGGLLFTDLIKRFAPFGFPGRAEMLERSWEDAWARHCRGAGCPEDRLRKPFLDIWQDTDTAWTPIVVVNGASEETGRRILTSKLRLTSMQVNADDFYVTTHSNVAASTAIHNGARFFYVSPAGLMIDKEGHRRGHIIDGGYFDPAGTEVARELAHAIVGGPGAAQAADLKFIFLFIGYGTSSAPALPAPSNSPEQDVSVVKPTTHCVANEIVAPVIGLASSRDGHAQHMARNLKADVARDGAILNTWSYAGGKQGEGALFGSYLPILLCDDPNREDKKRKFVMPMDWALSDYAVARMKAAVTKCGVNGYLTDVVTNLVTAKDPPPPPAVLPPAPPAALPYKRCGAPTPSDNPTAANAQKVAAPSATPTVK